MKKFILPILLMCIPIGAFVWKFYDYKLSDNPDDWQTFAGYFGGTVGTIASIYAGYLVYKTFDLQARTLEAQVNQNKHEKHQANFQFLFDYFTEINQAMENLKTKNHDGGFALTTLLAAKLEIQSELKGIQTLLDLVSNIAMQVNAYFSVLRHNSKTLTRVELNVLFIRVVGFRNKYLLQFHKLQTPLAETTVVKKFLETIDDIETHITEVLDELSKREA